MFAMLCLLELLVLLKYASTFNIDTEQPTLFRSPKKDSYFGFSLNLFKNDDYRKRSILIGAPLADSDRYRASEVNKLHLVTSVKFPGAVFQCDIERKERCREMVFDEQSNNFRRLDTGQYVQAMEKSHMWLGASIDSADDLVVTCAPRFRQYRERYGSPTTEPVGACFIYNFTDSSSSTHYEPCTDLYETPSWGMEKTGSCQIGFSLSFSEGGKYYVAGAVGSRYWQGQLYLQSTTNETYIRATEAFTKDDDDMYMGYSMGVGEFNGDETMEEYVVAAPKASSLTGILYIFDQKMRQIRRLRGDEQIGAYFGYSIAVGDFNGDEYDDIAVGSPFYSITTDDEMKVEVGRVDVFYQRHDANFKTKRKTVLIGEKPTMRFGMAVSNMGDLNQDGYDDLAVGAPYDGSGAVYFYYGSQNGLRNKFSQVLRAEQFRLPQPFSSFGAVLTGGVDMDDNGYPDLAIAAYQSDKVLYFRTRAVVKVKSKCEVTPQVVRPDRKPCIARYSDGSTARVACVSVLCCLRAIGQNIPERVSLTGTWHADAKKNVSKRAYLLEAPQRAKKRFRIDLNRDENNCQIRNQFLVKENRDKLSAMVFELSWKLDAQGFRGVPPILNGLQDNKHETKATFQRDCGPDFVCNADLRLSTEKVPREVQIGQENYTEFTIIVHNFGEDAYESVVEVAIPRGLGFATARTIQSESDVLVICTELVDKESDDQLNVIHCDVGNPLKQQRIAKFLLSMAISDVQQLTPRLTFNISANSTNVEDEETSQDNTLQVEIPVRIVSQLNIRGNSQPTNLIYNSTQARISEEQLVFEEDVGPAVTQEFTVVNTGPSNITEAEIKISWPSFYESEMLLYALREPQVSGTKSKCESSRDSNPNRLRKKIKRAAKPTASSSLSDFIFGRVDTEIPQITCSGQDCTYYKCVLYDLTADKIVKLRIYSRLFIKTLLAKTTRDVIITSTATVIARRWPYSITSPINFRNTTTVHLEARPSDLKPQQKPLNLWIIVIAAALGFLLLLIIILILWRLGFFKRKRFAKQEQKALMKAVYEKREQDFYYS